MPHTKFSEIPLLEYQLCLAGENQGAVYFSILCLELSKVQVCKLLLNSKLFFNDESLSSPLERDRQKCHVLKLDQSFENMNWHDWLFFL